MASVAPWLITLSKYKAWTFGLTALALAYAHSEARRVEACDLTDARRLRWQTRMLWGSTLLFLVSLFAAYALLPLTLWIERQQA